MIFSSVSFLFVFLPLFLTAYFILPWKNAVLLAFSIFFYFWGEGYFTLVLLVSIVFNYISGSFIAKTDGRSRKWALGIGIGLNLLLLIFYKYAGFLLIGILHLPVPESWIPHLPLGISFFTFQSMSYLIDVYRRQVSVAPDIFHLATYISMFPQLVAGPIVRYSAVEKELRKRDIEVDDVVVGIQYFVVGLAQKALIANNVAIAADGAFDLPASQLTMAFAWVGLIAYTLQIYFDFAGYSNMAIGMGRMLGFRFPINFNTPYISASVTEFWRRWHISLSTWFRDYLYIPMGGSHNGPWRTYANLLTVFVLCGLWHGASWSFLIWGLIHGALLVFERIGLGKILGRLPRLLATIYTLLMVMIAWVFFRADTLPEAVSYLGNLVDITDLGLHDFRLAIHANNEVIFYMLLGIFAATPLMAKLTRLLVPFDSSLGAGLKPNWHLVPMVSAMALLYVASATYIATGNYNPFIYFRF